MAGRLESWKYKIGFVFILKTIKILMLVYFNRLKIFGNHFLRFSLRDKNVFLRKDFSPTPLSHPDKIVQVHITQLGHGPNDHNKNYTTVNWTHLSNRRHVEADMLSGWRLVIAIILTIILIGHP